MIRTYSELSKFPSFEERYEYLRLKGVVGKETFGFERFLNQYFYKSKEWRSIRDTVIIRDCGCDLGMEGCDIFDKVIVHHMNPLTKYDIQTQSEFLLNPEYLICTSHHTHNAIHYGDEKLLRNTLAERHPNDTCPWKR